MKVLGDGREPLGQEGLLGAGGEGDPEPTLFWLRYQRNTSPDLVNRALLSHRNFSAKQNLGPFNGTCSVLLVVSWQWRHRKLLLRYTERDPSVHGPLPGRRSTHEVNRQFNKSYG